MIVKLNDFLLGLDKYLGSSNAFVFLLIGTGVFFTVYLGFPQIRYFGHALKVVAGKYDRHGDKGDTSHFQALATALSGTVGTGNIAGVALAIYMGGPAALFWMLMTALLGMCTKFVEVLLSHKYREFDSQGRVAGGPMYYMKKRLNISLANGKTLKTGYFMGGLFAVSTIFCSFGTGSLPQINSISNVIYSSFGIPHFITGAVLAIFLALVILGGIKRIARVTSALVPVMAIVYFTGAIAVLVLHYKNIIPAIESVFSDVFSGTAAIGGFLGAGVKTAVQRGVNRGLFSNEAGQGSAPIAHAAARAHEPVSEGVVAILEPFIDTVIICMLTGLTILVSGVWTEKYENRFQTSDMVIIEGIYSDTDATQREHLFSFLNGDAGSGIIKYNGTLLTDKGIISDQVTVINSRSVAENVSVMSTDGLPFSGEIQVIDGIPVARDAAVYFYGRSLLHSAPLTAEAFKEGLFGNFGQYIVSIGLLLFAFSTAISWSYYGDRAVTYLWDVRYVIHYRIIYVIAFFIASITDTTLIWTFSGITIVLMAVPNLIGLLILRKEVKMTIADYWKDMDTKR